jgi:hypothetical protein
MNATVELPLAEPRRSASAWKIWSNPIFIRYCRSRLRVRGLGLALLITVIVAGFLYFMVRTIAIYNADVSVVAAERSTLIPLLIVQGIILFLLGTGQVAGGMTAEYDEGVLDYQRLAPMSPLSKVFGYLFGLPIREYAMFAATLPFTVWALWQGGIGPATWVPLYAVFFTSTVLYHLTGLVAGTVVKNKRWAFLVSIVTVSLLYTVIPQMSRFGLVYFKYLTMWPVLEESLPAFLPELASDLARMGLTLLKRARFFNLDFHEAVFTIFAQGVLILTFIEMLWRRWRRAESHLLGKTWATGFFAWIHFVLLGNALPLIEPGNLFPSREVFRRFQRFPRSDWAPAPGEAVVMVGLYGLVTMLLLFVLTSIITPVADTQIRAWRRMRKLGQRTIPPFSDAATAFWFVVLMAVIGGAGWFIFTRAIIDSRWFPGQHVPLWILGTFILVLLSSGLCYHALLEARGVRALTLASIFVGVVPMMVGAVLSAISVRLWAPAAWLIGLSPASAPVYASATTLPVSELPVELRRSIPSAFWFWQAVLVLGAIYLIADLRRARRKYSQTGL